MFALMLNAHQVKAKLWVLQFTILLVLTLCACGQIADCLLLRQIFHFLVNIRHVAANVESFKCYKCYLFIACCLIALAWLTLTAFCSNRKFFRPKNSSLWYTGPVNDIYILLVSGVCLFCLSAYFSIQLVTFSLLTLFVLLSLYESFRGCLLRKVISWWVTLGVL